MKPFCPRCQRLQEDTTTSACGACGLARPPFGWPRDGLLGQRLDGGRLHLVERLGEGGFGVVYRAVQVPGGQARAVKVLSEQHGADPQVQRLFLKEAEALQRMSHSNLVRCDAFGFLDEARPWISMELIEGRSLREEVEALGPLPPRRALALAAQVCAALAVAHKEQVLHRDLNPRNIMLCDGAPPPGRVKVIDFGLAKVLGQNTVDQRTNRIIGTPEFMAPEQFNPGTPLDARLDLWQLGAVLYFMLTGQPPWPSSSPQELLRLHHRWLQERREHLPGPRPSALRPALQGEALDDLVSQLLSADVTLRPSSAQQLLAMLANAAPHHAPATATAETQAAPSLDEAELRPTAEQPASADGERARLCPRCQGSAPLPQAQRCEICGQERPAAGWPEDPLAGRAAAQGRYGLLFRAGMGLMGPVYEAIDHREGRAVALRLIQARGGATDTIRRLLTERFPALCALRHPNLVSILDQGELDPEGLPFLVMERAYGTPLHLRIWPPRYGFPRLMSPPQVMQYGVQLASALGWLHQAGQVHGGVTPSNLLLMEHREAGAQIQLTGLGNAHLRQAARQGGAHLQLSDPRFASAEELGRGVVGDPRSDLYQLGAMLHFMLTGWPPWATDERNPRSAATRDELLALQRAWDAPTGPRPSRWIPSLTAWTALDDAVAQLLHPRPDARPADALQVALQLSDALRAATASTRHRAALDHTQDLTALHPGEKS
jgi:serine/threonine protein kinase